MPIILPESGTVTTALIEPYVTPGAPSAPPEEIDQSIRLAAAEFCRRTGVWSEQLPGMVTTAGTEIYPLDRPVDSDVHKLLRASVNGLPWRLVTYQEGLRTRQDEGANLGEAAFMDPMGRLHLAPAPTESGQAIETDAVLVPTIVGTYLPGLLAPFVEDIAHGALARLHMARGTDYYDPAAAQWRTQRFNERIHVAGLRVSRGMSSAFIGRGIARKSRFY